VDFVRSHLHLHLYWDCSSLQLAPLSLRHVCLCSLSLICADLPSRSTHPRIEHGAWNIGQDQSGPIQKLALRTCFRCRVEDGSSFLTKARRGTDRPSLDPHLPYRPYQYPSQALPLPPWPLSHLFCFCFCSIITRNQPLLIPLFRHHNTKPKPKPNINHNTARNRRVRMPSRSLGV